MYKTPGVNAIKLVMDGPSTLVCLSLTSLSSLVQCLQVRPEPTRVFQVLNSDRLQQRQDNQYNDIQHNNTQQNRHNRDTQHLSI
jgi:hypothetical protein